MMQWRDKRNGTGPGKASDSDAELVHAARRGDKRAFVEIVARHQAMLCGIAFAILGDFAASEDAAQEAFLAAWRKFHDLREPARLRPWLGEIVRNAAIGHLRRQREYEALDGTGMVPEQSPAPDEIVASEEEAALVRESLSQLPETYRLPLVLFYREGQSVRAVAESLGITEDAVKQRLSRGREMLRERMSGLIETVLTRTGPTAVFTMTIAAAIGALTAPAAVAASVFTASAAASATSTAAASPVLTIMSTSKSFLVATALVAVAFIPVGYNISTSKQPPAETNVVSQAEAEVRTNAKPYAPKFDSALFAEWRELHEKHGTNAAAMPALHKAISDIKNQFRRRAFYAALVAEWVQVDAPGGLKFYLGKGRDDFQRRQFIQEWLALDPRAAVDALLASDSGWEGAARGSLSEIAKRVPSRLAEVIARLPDAENHWDTSVRDAFAILAGSDLDSARKSAEAMTGPSREQSLAGVAQAWAKRDFNGAVAWAKALPDGTDRNEIIRAALLGAAAVNPAAALESANLVPGGGRAMYFADTTGARVLAEAAKTDFDAVVAWLRDHPGQFGRGDLMGLAQSVSERLNADPIGFLNTSAASGTLSALLPAIGSGLLNEAGGQRAIIWDWLKTQPENEATKSLRSEALSTAASQDPELALQWMADIPQTKEGDAQVGQLAERLINGTEVHRFEELYAEAPERLRQPLVEAVFKVLGYGNVVDPQQWIDRLSLLPEASRAKGIESIARGWAAQAPEEAAGWASLLAAGEAQNDAVAAIASTWAARDAYGAAEWVTGLPAGAERDRGAESLAMAIAEKFPREAWEWALSIGDGEARSRAAALAVKMMAARDPGTARQWIETGPFTDATRTQLQASLAQKNK